MVVAIALLLNVLLLTGAGWWLRREHRLAVPGLRRWLLPALAIRLIVTGIAASFPSSDTQLFTYWSRAFTAEFWAQPGAALALWRSQEIYVDGQVFTKYTLSNTLFIIKLVGVLNLASLGNELLNALYLSLFCFAGCWLLARTWGQLFPATPPLAPVLALLLWPSLLWWTASVGKETVLLGSETALVALVLTPLYGPALPVGRAAWLRAAGRLLAVVACAWLACRMRYFYGLPLLGALLALALVRLGQRRGWLGCRQLPQALLLLLLLLVGGGLGLGWAVGQVSEGFYTQQFYHQYLDGLASSAGRPHLLYPHLLPSASSLLRHAPLAVGQVLTRPWLGESWRVLYIGAALENALLLLLMLLAVSPIARGRPGRLPLLLVLTLLAYCLVVAALIGLSTPNLGTLHRYRAGLLPWLLLLLLQNDYARWLLRKF